VAQQQEAYDPGAVDWNIVDAAGTVEATLAHAKAAISR
jgi:hypothetical protein